MLKWLMKLSYIPHNSSMVAIQEDLEGAWWIGHCEGSLGKPSVQPGTDEKKALHTWRLATCRLPSPQCSHIWGGTTCSPRLVQGTEDSACRTWAAHSQCGSTRPADTSPDWLWQKGVVEEYLEVGLKHINVSLI